MKVKETSSKYGAVIINCNCIHEFQDRTYGKGKRVASLCSKGKTKRCTVCNKEQ